MDFEHYLSQYGLPTAMLVALVFMLWRAIRWAARNVAEPVVKRHIEFLNTAERQSEKQSECLIKLADSQEAQVKQTESIKRELSKQTEVLTKQTDVLVENGKTLAKITCVEANSRPQEAHEVSRSAPARPQR